MSPPGLTATPGIGVTASPSMDDLKSFAHTVFTNIGVGDDYGPNKVNKLVTRFARAMPNANGWAFFLYLANAVQMTADEQRAVLLDPDIAPFITYADPTGETATHHVHQQQMGRRR
jgi:hypothetical protein